MSAATLLPEKPQTSRGLTPANARVMLAGTPKVGKSTLAAGWLPEHTLIVDTQKGTELLDGEHYVAHVNDWRTFEQVVDQVIADPRFKVVVLDMIDDLWTFADRQFAGKGAAYATATDDYGRAGKNAEGIFRTVIGKLLASDMGVWFLTHTRLVEDDGVTRYVPKLDGKVVTWIQGATQFVLLAEAIGPKRQLHTAPSAKFEAGSRVPLPEPLELDARALWGAIDKGLKARASTGPKEVAA